MFVIGKSEKIKSIVLLLLTSLMVACGGGGGGDNNNQAPSPTGISGTVTAPGGAVAQLQSKSMFAFLVDAVFPAANATLTGTSTVSNAQVDLIRVDANGVMVGDVIESTATDTNGAFDFDIDISQIPSGVLILRVDSGSAVMRAIVSEPVIEINPVTEYVLSKIEAIVASDPAIDFSYFTPEEVQNMVDTVNLITVDVTGATIAEAVAAIAAQADSALAPEMATATINLSGAWFFEETTGSNTCGEQVGIVYLQANWTVLQEANIVTINFENGTPYGSGVLEDLQITGLPLDSFPEQGGVTTVLSQSYQVALDGNLVSATYNWSWTSSTDGFTCSGTNFATISRIVN